MTTTANPINTPEFDALREHVIWLHSFALIASDLNQDSNGETVDRPQWPTYLIKRASELNDALEAFERATLAMHNAKRAEAPTPCPNDQQRVAAMDAYATARDPA